MASGVSGWVFVVRGLPATGGTLGKATSDSGSGPWAPEAVSPSSGHSSQVIPGYLTLVDRALTLYRSSPRTDSQQDLIFTGVVRSGTIAQALGRRVLSSGQVLHVFSLSSGPTSMTPESRNIEFGCSTAQAADEWVQALEIAAMETSYGREKSTALTSGELPTPKEVMEKALVVPISGSAPSSEVLECDAVESMTWRLIGLTNALRVFEGQTSEPIAGNRLLKAEGVVETTPDRIFEAIMDLHQANRAQWDMITTHAEVLEVIDGFTDMCSFTVAVPGTQVQSQARVLTCRRTWRRNEDGSYVISFNPQHQHGPQQEEALPSTSALTWDIVPLCCPRIGRERNVVRHRCRSLVRHVLEIEKTEDASYAPSSVASRGRQWAFSLPAVKPFSMLKSLALDPPPNTRDREREKETTAKPFRTVPTGLHQSAADPDTLRGFMDGIPFHLMCRIAGLREYFASMPLEADSDPPAGVYKLEEVLVPVPAANIPEGLASVGGEEFFDALENSVRAEESLKSKEAARRHWQHVKWLLKVGTLLQSVHGRESNIPQGFSWFVQRELLHNVGRVDLDAREEAFRAACNVPRSEAGADVLDAEKHSWRDPGGTNFFIRGPTYLEDHVKIPAGDPLLKLVGMDWFQGPSRMDNVASCPGTLPQTEVGRGLPFLLVVNLQVPGPPFYSLILYFAADLPVRTQKQSLLYRFFTASSDTFRNNRFKLIPRIAEGNWVVKRAVGTTACIVGQKLKCQYFRGSNYLEMDCDIGSSSVARNVIGLVISYLSTLIIDLAFLIEAQEASDLPEYLLGTATCIHLDVKNATNLEQANV